MDGDGEKTEDAEEAKLDDASLQTKGSDFVHDVGHRQIRPETRRAGHRSSPIHVEKLLCRLQRIKAALRRSFPCEFLAN